MVDYELARQHMVDNLVRTSSVSDLRLLAQLGAVPREDFVAPARRPVAYVDDIQWFEGQYERRFMAPPAVLAKLLQLADIAPTDDVLIVGAATGYSVALVAGLAASVVGIEREEALAAVASRAVVSYPNASIRRGEFDHPVDGKFDVVLIEGAVASVPETLVAALRDGGRLVAPVVKSGVPVAHVFLRRGTDITSRAEFKVALPMLIAEDAGAKFVF
jgi:protein-L-isoaspartate(D-aspartate) O-methyltransferase